MAGLFGVSINPQEYEGRFGEDLYLGGFYGQHNNEKNCGFATKKDSDIDVIRAQGLVRANFKDKRYNFRGTEGIAYCGSAEEPFKCVSRWGKMALCFSGNVINCAEILSRVLKIRGVCERADEAEIFAELITEGDSVANGINMLANDGVKGAFALLVLTKDGIHAISAPHNQWPLVIGQKRGAVAVATESTGFSNMGFETIRTLGPREMILLNNGKIETIAEATNHSAVCKFLGVYTANPTAKICGIPVSLIRKELGGALAQKDIDSGLIPDRTCCVPDSGRFHLYGYHQRFCKAVNDRQISRVPLLDGPLVKYSYAGRSFMFASAAERLWEAHTKILQGSECFDGEVLVILEDSVVRGSQFAPFDFEDPETGMKFSFPGLAKKLRDMGFKEIHLRAANPELLSHCPWGKTTKAGETLVDRFPALEDRAAFLGVDSLRYNSLEDLYSVYEKLGLPRHRLCVDCALRH